MSGEGVTTVEQAAGGDLFCPKCHYNLRGNESGRCPECGEGFDRATLAVSKIPWVHRGRIGRVRGFLGTVWMAMRRPGELGSEVARPVDEAAARRFGYVVMGVAWVMLVAGFLGRNALFSMAYEIGSENRWRVLPALWPEWLLPWLVMRDGPAFWLGAPLAALPGLWAAKRTVALSYRWGNTLTPERAQWLAEYAFSMVLPLALMLVVGVFVAYWLDFQSERWFPGGKSLSQFVWLAMYVGVGAMCGCSAGTYLRSSTRSSTIAVLVGGFMPTAAIITFVVGAGLTMYGMGAIAIVLRSLW